MNISSYSLAALPKNCWTLTLEAHWEITKRWLEEMAPRANGEWRTRGYAVSEEQQRFSFHFWAANWRNGLLRMRSVFDGNSILEYHSNLSINQPKNCNCHIALHWDVFSPSQFRKKSQEAGNLFFKAETFCLTQNDNEMTVKEAEFHFSTSRPEAIQWSSVFWP